MPGEAGKIIGLAISRETDKRTDLGMQQQAYLLAQMACFDQ